MKRFHSSPQAIWRAISLLLLLGGGEMSGAAAEQVQFVDVAEEAGIDFIYVSGGIGEKYMPEGMGSGAAFCDFDGDGFLDLYLINGAPLPGFEAEGTPKNVLYRNRGDGTFIDISEKAGVEDEGYGMGAATGDYDNDGDQDLYVTNVGANVLYRNEGEGTFADITGIAGVGDSGWGTQAAFVDYDNDGDLDLYVANYLMFDVADHIECQQGDVRVYCSPTAYVGQSGVLYRNEGNNLFADVTEQAGLVTEAGRQLGAIFGDYDRDGDQDLFVANDKTPNFLFENNGDGTFHENGLMAGVAYNEEGEPESAMGADWGDYDNDGHLDIIVATYQWVANTLYHNDGDGFFTDVTFRARLGAESLPYLGMTVAFLDYDNDGFLDIFAANGHIDDNVEEFDPSTSFDQRNQLFRNEGDGTFVEVTDESGPGLREAKVSHGATFGDYDNDGDVDIFVSDGGNQPSQLLRNDGGNRNHYLVVQLAGTRSNQNGIGARMELTAGDLTLTREVRSSYGYLCANDLRVIFGLGQHTSIDRLVVRWPSGIVQTFEDLDIDQTLVIEETE